MYECVGGYLLITRRLINVNDQLLRRAVIIGGGHALAGYVRTKLPTLTRIDNTSE